MAEREKELQLSMADKMGVMVKEGCTQVHIVKHAPKTDQEMLDELVKSHTATQPNIKRVAREAKAELRQKKLHQVEREANLAQVSEASDIETVKPSSALFSVDVNLDNLQSHLALIKNVLRSQDNTLIQLDRRINQRATEKAIGQYLERISQAVPTSLGKRPHAFKLDDPAFFEQEYDTEHGHVLKSGVEKLIEKLEIMSSVAAKNKKFKVRAESRIDKLEKQF